MWVFNWLILVLLHKVVKLLCMVRLSPLCSLVLFFAFKYIAFALCAVFTRRTPPDLMDKTSCYKFFFKKYITPFVLFVKV